MERGHYNSAESEMHVTLPHWWFEVLDERL
jgi:hypothetical protein